MLVLVKIHCTLKTFSIYVQLIAPKNKKNKNTKKLQQTVPQNRADLTRAYSTCNCSGHGLLDNISTKQLLTFFIIKPFSLVKNLTT